MCCAVRLPRDDSLSSNLLTINLLGSMLSLSNITAPTVRVTGTQLQLYAHANQSFARTSGQCEPGYVIIINLPAELGYCGSPLVERCDEHVYANDSARDAFRETSTCAKYMEHETSTLENAMNVSMSTGLNATYPQQSAPYPFSNRTLIGSLDASRPTSGRIGPQRTSSPLAPVFVNTSASLPRQPTRSLLWLLALASMFRVVL